jgi:O-antigen ligase
MMRRLMPAALAAVFAAIPFFPAFIALTSVAFPGVSLLPKMATLTLLAVCCVIAVYALATLMRYRVPRGQPLLLPLLAVFGACLLAAVLGFDPRGGLLFVCIFGLGIVWHCSVVRFYQDRYAPPAIFWSYLLSGTIASTAAIVMVVTRAPVAQYVIQHGRATGTFILPGELAGYLIIFLPIAYALGRVARRRALRAFAWIALAVGLATLALTYSRAGWMGFAAAAAFLIAAQTRRLRHGAGAAAIVVAAGAVVALLLRAHHNPSEDYTRLSIWQTAEQIIDRYPLTGVGPFDFSRLYAVLRLPDGEPTAFHAHNVYLTFLAELGIVGVAAVGWTLWRFAIELRSRSSNARAPETLLALGVTAGLVGVAVQGLIDTVSVVIFGLWLPMMGLALAAAKQARAKGASADG